MQCFSNTEKKHLYTLLFKGKHVVVGKAQWHSRTEIRENARMMKKNK